MPKQVAIGIQDFSKIVEDNCFYVDKTHFIKEWWANKDDVTLITRPRRFGKTLTMSMVEHFFSIDKKNHYFDNLFISNYQDMMQLQNTYPVINISFSKAKGKTFESIKAKIYQVLLGLYDNFSALVDNSNPPRMERAFWDSLSMDMDETAATEILCNLSKCLCRYYGKKAIILLDEYDTPMQEAYINGYWDEMSDFMRSFFNCTFKTNEYIMRALLTGITHVSKESLFSDFNNLMIITTSSDDYADVFGFTEEEVFNTLEAYGLCAYAEEVREEYDGFVFGGTHHIYNPWSVLNFLRKKEVTPYWANTSSNRFVGFLLQKANKGIKQQMEMLLTAENITVSIDEHIVFKQLEDSPDAIWSFMLAGGYLKLLERDYRNKRYTLAITNNESKEVFQTQITDWFKNETSYRGFVGALMSHDLEEMNDCLNELAVSMVSSFDAGNKPSKDAPERFYHGFVLGLLVDLRETHVVTSNRESGLGRYDVIIEPKDKKRPAFIFEFKVNKPKKEKTLQDTVNAALRQIEERKYGQQLLDHGFKQAQIRKYGFAFRGKDVLIGDTIINGSC